MDIALIPDEYGNFDIAFEEYDIKTEDSLKTLIYGLLYSDARDDMQEEPRGWIGETLDEAEKGSKLWTIRTTTSEDLRKLEDYSNQALKPLVDWKIAEKIEATAQKDQYGAVLINIDIIKDNKSNKYTIPWSNI